MVSEKIKQNLKERIHKRVRGVFLNLPREERLVYAMYYVPVPDDGNPSTPLSFLEIAVTLDISLDEVEQRYLSVYKKIRSGIIDLIKPRRFPLKRFYDSARISNEEMLELRRENSYGGMSIGNCPKQPQYLDVLDLDIGNFSHEVAEYLKSQEEK